MNPRNVQIQTTSICNGTCSICPYQGSEVQKTAKFMDDVTFYAVIDSLKGVTVKKLAMYMQGEPFTDPLILGRVLYAMQHVTAEIAELSTNCTLFTPEMARKTVQIAKQVKLQIWLSYHGEEITHVPNEKIWKNLFPALKILTAENIKCAVVSSPNTDERRKYLDGIFEALGIVNKPHIMLPKLTNRGGLLKNISCVLRDDYRCSRHTDWIHFDVDGNVVMCCDDYQRKVKFGNIKDKSLESIVASIPEQVEKLAESDDFICYHCSTPGNIK